MRISIISPALPPALDGIGDYSALLSARLVESAAVRVLTAAGPSPDAIPGVEVAQVFSTHRRRSVRGLFDTVVADKPDWVVLQFQQFAYGRWGLNPYLPAVMRKVARQCPSTRVAVMFHEDFVPAINWKFAVMRVWQKWQFRTLGRSADAIFFSIDPWVRRYAPWFPGKPVAHLPVGSNIPPVELSRREARARLGIPDGKVVLGLFGAVHPTRNLPWLRAAARAVGGAASDLMLLYIGADGAAARRAMAGIPAVTEGPLPAAEVSRRLRAVDVYLTPFSDGVSTRRGSMMAGLEHGLATVGTRGELTDALLEADHGRGILLADARSPDEFAGHVRQLLGDPALRERLGRGAAELYEREFAWPRVAARLLEVLSGPSRRGPGRGAKAADAARGAR